MLLSERVFSVSRRYRWLLDSTLPVFSSVILFFVLSSRSKIGFSVFRHFARLKVNGTFFFFLLCKAEVGRSFFFFLSTQRCSQVTHTYKQFGSPLRNRKKKAKKKAKAATSPHQQTSSAKHTVRTVIKHAKEVLSLLFQAKEAKTARFAVSGLSQLHQVARTHPAISTHTNATQLISQKHCVTTQAQ